MGLVSEKNKISIAKEDIPVYKVMLKIKGKYYVCPPAYGGRVVNGIKPEDYKLEKVHKATDQFKPKTADQKEDGTIGSGFFHTFEKLEDAKAFKLKVEESIQKHNIPGDPQRDFFAVPGGSEIVILIAKIPKGSFYWKGIYNRTDTSSYASDKIIYENELGVYKIKRFSWNSWIDKRIENSDKRIKKIRDREKFPITTEEKELTKKLKDKIKSSGVDLVFGKKSKGAAFIADPEVSGLLDNPKDVFKHTGIKPGRLKKGQKTIIIGKNTRIGSLAHELGHSTEDPIYKWSFNGKKIGTAKRLIEETRANLRGYRELKKLNPSKDLLDNSKKYLVDTEKYYLEKSYQDILKKLKTKKYSILDKLAGREVFYHGTSKEKAEKIKKEGLKPGLGENTKDMIENFKRRGLKDEYGHPIDPKSFENKLYLNKKEKFANTYKDIAKKHEGSGEILEISVPYKIHKKYKRGVNPERGFVGVQHLKSKDDFSRTMAGKPYKDLSSSERKTLSRMIDYENSEYVLDNTTISPKYIKGSDKYKPVSLKEIWDYQTRKLKK